MSVIDLTVFNNLKDATGADFISVLIETYFEDSLDLMKTLKTALAAGDAESFRRAAHTLKSNAAMFGATELSAQARELEMMGREKNLEVGNKLEALQEAFEQVRDELKELK